MKRAFILLFLLLFCFIKVRVGHCAEFKNYSDIYEKKYGSMKYSSNPHKEEWSLDILKNNLENNHVVSINLDDKGLEGTAIYSNGYAIDFTIPGIKEIPPKIRFLAEKKSLMISKTTTKSKIMEIGYILIPLIQFIAIILILIFAIKIYKKIKNK